MQNDCVPLYSTSFTIRPPEFLTKRAVPVPIRGPEPVCEGVLEAK